MHYLATDGILTDAWASSGLTKSGLKTIDAVNLVNATKNKMGMTFGYMPDDPKVPKTNHQLAWDLVTDPLSWLQAQTDDWISSNTGPSYPDDRMRDWARAKERYRPPFYGWRPMQPSKPVPTGFMSTSEARTFWDESQRFALSWHALLSNPTKNQIAADSMPTSWKDISAGWNDVWRQYIKPLVPRIPGIPDWIWYASAALGGLWLFSKLPKRST